MPGTVLEGGRWWEEYRHGVCSHGPCVPTGGDRQ